MSSWRQANIVFLAPWVFPRPSLASLAKGGGGKIRRIIGRATCWRGVCGGGKTPRFFFSEAGGCRQPALVRRGFGGTPSPWVFFLPWLSGFFLAEIFFVSVFFLWSVFPAVVFFLRRFFSSRKNSGSFLVGVRLVLFGLRCISGFFRDSC